MDKLYEVISKSYGSKFEFEFGETKKELTLDRFSAIYLVEIEQELGISIENFGAKLVERLATNVTLIGWKLLIEKDEFNNSLEVFRSCLTAEMINKLAEKIFEAFSNSLPKGKNVKGPEKTK
jgi:hypothetical protein